MNRQFAGFWSKATGGTEELDTEWLSEYPSLYISK